MDNPGELTACDICQAKTVAPDLLQRWPREVVPGLNRPARLCHYCAQRAHAERAVWIYWGTVVGIGIAAAFYFFVGQHGTWLDWLAAVAEWMIFSRLMVALHEAGHAIAGWLMGMHVFGIVLGQGRPLWKWRTRNFFFQLKAIPIGGLAYVSPPVGKQWPLRSAIMVAAGPLVHAIALAGIGILWIAGGMDDREFDWISQAIVMLALVNLWYLSGSLWWGNGSHDGHVYLCDRQQFFKYLRREKEWLTKQSAGRVHMELQLAAETNDAERAEKWFSVALKSGAMKPEEGWDLRISHMRGDWEKVAEQSRSILDREPLPARREVMGRICLARAAIHLQNWDEADRETCRCMELMSWSAVVLTLRAAVLIHRGELESAEGLLRLAWSREKHGIVGAETAYAWAELSRKKGDFKAMHRWERLAVARDPRGRAKMDISGSHCVKP